jgi:hypothetical protein
MASSHISHQTGAEFFTFPAQMIESIELIRQPPANQIVREIVGILRDRICRGNGMSTRMTEIKPSTGNSGYSISARIKGKEGMGEGNTETQLKGFRNAALGLSMNDHIFT